MNSYLALIFTVIISASCLCCYKQINEIMDRMTAWHFWLYWSFIYYLCIVCFSVCCDAMENLEVCQFYKHSLCNV